MVRGWMRREGVGGTTFTISGRLLSFVSVRARAEMGMGGSRLRMISMDRKADLLGRDGARIVRDRVRRKRRSAAPSPSL